MQTYFSASTSTPDPDHWMTLSASCRQWDPSVTPLRLLPAQGSICRWLIINFSLASPPPNTSAETQAMARVKCIGQTQKVKQMILVLEDSPDRIITAPRSSGSTAHHQQLPRWFASNKYFGLYLVMQIMRPVNLRMPRMILLFDPSGERICTS